LPRTGDAAPSPIIVWFGDDLRTADHPALAAAAATGAPVVPLYILDDETTAQWPLGGAQRWWLEGSLAALAESLARLGAPLVLRQGRAGVILPAIARAAQASAIYRNRTVHRCVEESAAAAAKAANLPIQTFMGDLLHPPETLRTRAGEPFKVFTPFWRAIVDGPPPPVPLGPPKRLRPGPALEGDDLAAWRLRPRRPDWAGGLRQSWQPGEDAARTALDQFIARHLAGYGTDRDRPDRMATSRLSPHLRWGEISPRQIWHAVNDAATDETRHAAQAFLRELGWREFSRHLLVHWPDLPSKPWRPAFARFPWRHDKAALAAWQRGATGYPIVDAGMRDLWQTGWMHNRVRMIVASFLTKHLLLPWQDGAAWFWDTLVDADLANNSAGWQWVAGCGADAAPYFRIFNPVAQGERFDPDGAYVRRWVPELSGLGQSFIHAPWKAPPRALAEAGIRLGTTYPAPIVDHAAARARALAAFRTIATGAAARLPPGGAVRFPLS